ncbi:MULTISPECIES: hypothetical protein [unclassified Moorena]|nr:MULTISPECIES: hypothetical protein [unclassified Moorena]NEO16830.1 hypothetical protein [Moorena sp. SIO3E8]NEQ03859.1 hypothetical protein [Moorena sp. SIO3F7]
MAYFLLKAFGHATRTGKLLNPSDPLPISHSPPLQESCKARLVRAEQV